MRRFLSYLAAALLLSVWVSAAAEKEKSAAPSRKYVIAISSFLEKEVKDDVFRRITRFLLEEVPLKSTVVIYDAYHLKTIAQLSVPELAAFNSSKTRANQYKEQILKLKEFLAAEHPMPESKLSMQRAVRVPQLMDLVAEQHASDSPTVVIVLGSPLYVDHKEPGFSMVNGYFPSDGHIMANRDQSIFGVKDRSALLQNVQVHFGYFGDPWISELHQDKIARFWSLYLKEQGAELASFSADLASTFKAAGAGTSFASKRPQAELDRTQSKLEMLRITRDIGVADWITRELPRNQHQPPPSRTVGPMKIGIRWQDQLDLDLYASSTPESETLFFEHTRAPEGYYFKDHRSSPEREYEFIEFETPVDVYKVKADINFYDGRVPAGATGEIRIEFDGRIYSRDFSIPATKGNKGRSGRSQADFWSHIDVPAILNLRESRQAAAESGFRR
jgi:hypothetical protein